MLIWKIQNQNVKMIFDNLVNVKLWEFNFYGEHWYVVEKLFAMATSFPLRTFKFECEMEKLWTLYNISSYDIEFYTLIFNVNIIKHNFESSHSTLMLPWTNLWIEP